MVYFARSPLGIIVASLCSMAVIAFTYLVIVKPQIDNANDQIDKSFETFVIHFPEERHLLTNQMRVAQNEREFVR